MRNVFLSVLLMAVSACGASRNASLQSLDSQLDLSFKPVEAGVDYPTDSPIPDSLLNKKVLVLRSPEFAPVPKRIVVDASATLADPVAGRDYPTDSIIPPGLVGKKILVLNSHYRFPVIIERPRAGRDYPSDSMPPQPPFGVWVFSQHNRLALNDMYAIEKAKAGVDYPTDGPSNVNRDFYVVVSFSGDTTSRQRIP